MKKMIMSGVVALGLWMGAQAQQKSAEDQTVVTAESFRLDMGKHQGFFSQNVQIEARDFRMKAQEMTVFFNEKDNKIEKLVARGEVEIDQPDRKAKANQVTYVVAEEKITLEGLPEVVQNKNKITGNSITIYRRDNRMDIDGRSKILLFETLGPKSSGKTDSKK